MSTDDPEEQIVGVLAWCKVCGEKTVHVAGVCRDHRVVRRRLRPVLANPVAAVRSVIEERRAGLAAEAAEVRARKQAKAKRKAERKNRVRYVLSLIFVGALVVAAGFFHVVYGSSISVHVCAKYGWSLADTAVNLDDYPPGPARAATRVGVALDECKL